MSESATEWIVIIIFRNRRSREANIVKVIEGGAKSLFDIIAYAYSDVDHRVWIAIIKCEAPCGSSSPTTQVTKGNDYFALSLKNINLRNT